jgi:type IV pilus assembly protein PilX
MKYSTQRGSVLLISLMILIVLTLLTFTAAKNVLLQEKMVASTRDSMLALEVAEAALLDAEARAFGMTYSDDGSTGAYQECGLVAGAACWMDTFKNYDNLFENGVD